MQTGTDKTNDGITSSLPIKEKKGERRPMPISMLPKSLIKVHDLNQVKVSKNDNKRGRKKLVRLDER